MRARRRSTELLSKLVEVSPELTLDVRGQRAMLMTQTGYQFSVFGLSELGCESTEAPDLYVIDGSGYGSLDDVLDAIRANGSTSDDVALTTGDEPTWRLRQEAVAPNPAQYQCVMGRR